MLCFAFHLLIVTLNGVYLKCFAEEHDTLGMCYLVNEIGPECPGEMKYCWVSKPRGNNKCVKRNKSVKSKKKAVVCFANRNEFRKIRFTVISKFPVISKHR